MAQRFPALVLAQVAAVIFISSACTGPDRRIQQHSEKLRSLSATTVTVGEAWLGGSASGTYARTALEEAYRLLEQERAALSQSPDDLRDERAAELSRSAEHLARLLALMIGDVREANAPSFRAHLAEIPLRGPEAVP